MIIDPSNLTYVTSTNNRPGQRALGIVLPVLFLGHTALCPVHIVCPCGSIIDYSHFGNWMGYEDILAIKKIISRYFPVIGGFVCAFLLWVVYDTLRFATHRDRCIPRPQPVSLEETAGFCHLETGNVREHAAGENPDLHVRR